MKKTNFLIFLLLIGLFIIFAGSCKKDDIPVLTTVEVTDITLSTAKSGGNITSEGGLKVVGRGVCWSTSANPSIADSHTTDGFGAGSFTSILTGLYGGTTYYVRAYATNINGTHYGEQRSFQTQNGMASVTTNDISNITPTTAKSGGNVTSDGGFPVTARGVCWSTSADPTIADSHTTDGSGAGSFTSVLTGLHLETTYYVRAYATNSNGTGYGSTMTFQTGGSSFTDFRDGNIYQTITIGNQVWMVENLRYLPRVVGPGTGSNTSPYYYVYGYDGTSVSAAKATANYNTFGVLYNWTAALSACPFGWHLPSDAEWEELENFLADNGYNYDGSTGGGRDKIAKAMASTTGWNSSSNTGAVGNTDYSQYQNKSGFTALPGGYRSHNGSFSHIGYHGYWWSATESSTNSAWTRRLNGYTSSVLRYDGNKGYGFSVRCVKD